MRGFCTRERRRCCVAVRAVVWACGRDDVMVFGKLWCLCHAFSGFVGSSSNVGSVGVGDQVLTVVRGERDHWASAVFHLWHLWGGVIGGVLLSSVGCSCFWRDCVGAFVVM